VLTAHNPKVMGAQPMGNQWAVEPPHRYFRGKTTLRRAAQLFYFQQIAGFDSHIPHQEQQRGSI